MPSLFFNSLIKIIDLLLQLNLFVFGTLKSLNPTKIKIHYISIILQKDLITELLVESSEKKNFLEKNPNVKNSIVCVDSSGGGDKTSSFRGGCVCVCVCVHWEINSMRHLCHQCPEYYTES